MHCSTIHHGEKVDATPTLKPEESGERGMLHPLAGIIVDVAVTRKAHRHLQQFKPVWERQETKPHDQSENTKRCCYRERLMEKGKTEIIVILFSEIGGKYFCILSGDIHHHDTIFHAKKGN